MLCYSKTACNTVQGHLVYFSACKTAGTEQAGVFLVNATLHTEQQTSVIIKNLKG